MAHHRLPGRPARQARPRPFRPQRPARRHDDHGRRPRPGLGPDHLEPRRGGRTRHRVLPPRPARRALPRSSYSLAPVAQRLSELLGRPVAFAADTVGESAQGRGRGASDGDVVLLENLRFNPGETAKDDDERAAFADAARRPRRRLRLRRLRRRAPQAGDRLRRRHPAARRWAGWSTPRSRCSSASPRTPSARTRSCSAARRSPTSSASSTTCCRRVDRLLIGGGMLFTFLAAQGHEVGTSLLEADQRRHRARATWSGPRSAASRSCCRSTSSCGREFSADTETVTVAADAIPADQDRARHRPGDGASCSPRRSPTPRRCSGTARWACSRWRRSRPARAACRAGARRGDREGRAHRRRRRRLRRGRAPARLRRRRVRPHLHRRRRLASSSSRARNCPASRSCDGVTERMAAGRTPLMAGNWKMNLDHLQATHFVQKLDWTLQGRQARLRRGRGRGAAAVHRPPHRADAHRRRQARAHATAPRTSPCTTSGAYTGEIAGRSSPSSAVAYVIVGHTERREYHDEADEVVNAKVQAAFRHGVMPIICVRRGPRGPPGRHPRRARRSRRSRPRSRTSPSSRPGHRRRLRAGLGDRHR